MLKVLGILAGLGIIAEGAWTVVFQFILSNVDLQVADARSYLLDLSMIGAVVTIIANVILAVYLLVFAARPVSNGLKLAARIAGILCIVYLFVVVALPVVGGLVGPDTLLFVVSLSAPMFVDDLVHAALGVFLFVLGQRSAGAMKIACVVTGAAWIALTLAWLPMEIIGLNYRNPDFALPDNFKAFADATALAERFASLALNLLTGGILIATAIRPGAETPDSRHQAEEFD